MSADVRQPERPGIADQLAEDAATARQWPDLTPLLLVDARVQESLQAGLLGIQDAERCVGRARQVARGLGDASKQRLQIELGDDGSAHLEQLFQPLVGELLPVRRQILLPRRFRSASRAT